jgi:MFS family permease
MRDLRAGFVSALVLSLMAGTFMGSALSALSTFLIDGFSMSAARFGLLITLFTLGGAVSAPLIGRMADAVPGRRMLTYHFLLCLLGILGAAFAPTYLALIVVVAICGLGGGSANPASNRLIALHVPRGNQGLVVGVKAAGQPLAVMAAGIVLPPVAAAYGWRPSLALGALIPAAGAALLRTIPADGLESGGTSSPNPSPGHRAVGMLALNGFAMGGGAAAVLSFLPLYSQQALNLSVGRAGLVFSLAGLTSVGARLAWGRATERFGHPSDALVWLSVASLAATGALAAAAWVGEWLAWTGAVAAGATMLSWNAVGMTAIVLEVGRDTAGRGSGVVMGGFLGGWMSTPVVFGWTVDTTGSYLPGWLLVEGLFLLSLLPIILWRRQRAGTGRARGAIDH